MTQTAMSPAEFEQALRAKGAYYHIHHPFHVAMYEGRATREQIQGWVANRRSIRGSTDRCGTRRSASRNRPA